MNIQDLPYVYISINPIHECTLACKYCKGSPNRPLNKKPRVIPGINMEQVEEGIETILKTVGPVSKVVGRFNSDDVFKCYNEIVKPTIEKYSNIYWSVHSNGILLREEHLDFFKENKVGLLISLDGPKEVQDINRLSKNGKSIFELVEKKIQMAKDKEIPLTVVSTFNEDSILKIYDSYLYHMEKKNRFSFLFDVRESDYTKIWNKILKEFQRIAIDYAQRSKEEQMLWLDISNKITKNNNTLHYSFSLNSRKIRTKTHLNHYEDFLEWDKNLCTYITSKQEVNEKKLIEGKSCLSNKEYCKYCWLNYNYQPVEVKEDYSIYCAILVETFKELEKKGYTKNDFTN